jgi:SNF2 family DNA or RNA helicase
VTLDELRAANPRLAGQSVKAGTPIIIPAKFIQGDHHTPMGPRVKHLFSVSIVDEAQDAKSKGTLAGENTRALHTKGRAIATGTLIAGYVTDLYWNCGWLVGQGHPLWPFPWRGGSARFLEQFGTYKWITKEFADTLETGQRRLIPSVSNLGRLWRLISAFSLRRTKDELLDDLPEKHREVHWVELGEDHSRLYGEVEGWASDEIIKATHAGAGDSHAAAMGRIGRALWKTRYCASTATANGHPYFADVLECSEDNGNGGLAGTPAKVAKALELVEEIREAGEKAIVFSSLDGLHKDMAKALLDAGIGFYDLKAVGNTTDRRLTAVRRFERDPGATVLLSGTKMLNRGVTIVAANHVVILNLEWSPEPTVQAEDRVHRPGQERDVFIHYILAAGTMEEDMYGLVMQKRETQEAVMDRKAKDQSVQEILADAVPMKKRLAEALVRNRSQRWEQALQHRTEAQAQAAEKPVERKRPVSARKSHRSERDNPWADWEALRQQAARQETLQSRGRTPPPVDTELQPALFTL